MQLRLEPAHPYQLFPANNRLKSYGHPSGLPSTSAFPFIDTYHQAHNALMNSLPSMMNNAAAACKRQSSLDPALGTFPSLLPLVETSSATSACSPVIPALADFAASMTYLMWHARKRMSIQPLNGHQNLPVDASKPNPAFKKFCLQLLTATQLSEPAVNLALKYISVLLRSNPGIEGAEGSEYRLFTVALMLANKFLDDSTYTNQTWSEVSGLKLVDLNTMEAEFLEAIGYSLFVRKEQYDQWTRALDDCRDTVKRMIFEGYRLRDELVRSVLLRLGLCEDLERMQRFRYYRENPVQEIHEMAIDEPTFSVNNQDRAHQMCLHNVLHAQDNDANAYGDFSYRPHRQTAPPPPISRNESFFKAFMSFNPPSQNRLSAFGDLGLPSPDDSNRRHSSQRLSLPLLPKPSHTSGNPSMYHPSGYMRQSVDYGQSYSNSTTTCTSAPFPPPGFTESDRLTFRITNPALQPQAPPSYKQDFHPSKFATATTHDADWRFDYHPYRASSSAAAY